MLRRHLMRLIRSLFGKNSAPAASPHEPGQDAAFELTARAWLFELFQRHGLVSTVHDDWVLPRAELPAIRGIWHPSETHGQLDMQVLVRNGVIIEECFAGIGAGDAGLTDGLQNFTINSFHPLLSALWSLHDPEQVEIQKWTAGGRAFSAFIGNVGTRSSMGVTPSIPADMMPILEAAIRSESLEHELHWFRFYVANVKGEFTFEALKNNEPWPAGVRALASCGWPPCEAFYSARLFMVLRAADGEAQAAA
jgi:hypothetical protein